MKEDEIREIIERVDPKGEISQNTQEDLVAALSIPTHGRVEDMGEVIEDDNKKLKIQIEEETDWRKRAELAAKIISNHLG